MMRYLALLKDSWQWAKDSKLILVIGILIFILTIASGVLIRISPDTTAFNKKFDVTSGETKGHFYHFNIKKGFEKTEDIIRYASNVWSYYVASKKIMQGAFGMPTRSSSTGSGDDYVFEVSVHKDKLKISKENVSNVLDMYLNTLFQAKTSVTRDADKWILESSGSVAIKLLPAKIGTIFFDKTFPTEIVSISELVIFIQSLFIELLTGFIGLLIGLLLTQDFVLKGLQSGRVELELSRPFSRGMYLLFKFIGSLAFFFLFSLVVIVPPSIGVYWQTGIFNVGFLLTTFFITFFFASIYCVSFTYGAITRRKGGTWFAIILWIVSISAYTLVMQSVPGKEDKIYKFASITHSILPKVGLIEKYCSYYLVHLSNLPTTYVQHLHSLPPYSLFYTLSTTFLFILLFLLVGIFFFRRKNF